MIDAIYGQVAAIEISTVEKFAVQENCTFYGCSVHCVLRGKVAMSNNVGTGDSTTRKSFFSVSSFLDGLKATVVALAGLVLAFFAATDSILAAMEKYIPRFKSYIDNIVRKERIIERIETIKFLSIRGYMYYEEVDGKPTGSPQTDQQEVNELKINPNVNVSYFKRTNNVRLDSFGSSLEGQIFTFINNQNLRAFPSIYFPEIKSGPLAPMHRKPTLIIATVGVNDCVKIVRTIRAIQVERATSGGWVEVKVVECPSEPAPSPR